MSWGNGYVTDTPYMSALNSSQSQPLAALAATINGFAARPARREEPYALCDIGCGIGTTALITAAANPGWTVVGLDFNAAHIAAAAELARAARLPNITFLEADLRDFAGTPEAKTLGKFDLITAHGLWSWVAPDVQDGILRLLGQTLKPGGLFHVSYNLLTGWQDALGLQRLIREAGQRLAHRADKQAQAGLKLAQTLAQAGGRIAYATASGRDMLDRLAEMPPAYVAHEMLNQSWRPIMHADIAARLAPQKLEFAGSTRLLTNFPQLTLTDAQRQIADQFDDPAMLELFKDLCHPQLLRSDIFIRGARRIDRAIRDATLMDTTIGLTAPPETWTFEFETGAGKAQMSEPYYRQIFERLRDGPATAGELLALPNLPGRRDNPAELLAVTVGTGQAVPIPNPGATTDEPCARLNLALLRAQFASGAGPSPIPFALPSLGHGLTLPHAEGMIAHELAATPHARDPHEIAARLAIALPAEQRAALAEKLHLFLNNDAPLLRHLGFTL